MSNNIYLTAHVDLKAEVKMHGMKISKERGLPIFVIQQYETDKLKKTGSIGTIKASVIEGDTYFPGLVY